MLALVSTPDPLKPSPAEAMRLRDLTEGEVEQLKARFASMRDSSDGDYWEPAVPLGPQGWKARLEDRLRRRGRLPRVVRFLGWWDERGLG